MAKELKNATEGIQNFTGEIVKKKRAEYKQRKIECAEAEQNSGKDLSKKLSKDQY